LAILIDGEVGFGGAIHGMQRVTNVRGRVIMKLLALKKKA
jgi:ribosomal protein S6E (S10)